MTDDTAVRAALRRRITAAARVRHIHAPITVHITAGSRALGQRTWDEERCHVCDVVHPCPTWRALDGEA